MMAQIKTMKYLENKFIFLFQDGFQFNEWNKYKFERDRLPKISGRSHPSNNIPRGFVSPGNDWKYAHDLSVYEIAGHGEIFGSSFYNMACHY